MTPIWHPYTQHQTAGEPLWIERAQGASLYDRTGREILDLVSSWWVNVHGHAHPKIAAAIAEQALHLEHVIFAGITHEPAERLAGALLERLGAPYTHLFFSDNGSTAVEVALKMALQEAINRGEPQRRKIIAFDGGFHGDTWGAMAVGRTSGFFSALGDLLSDDVLFAPFPSTWDDDSGVVEKEQRSLAHLDDLLDRHAPHTAGLIVEPLIQGASGMRMARPQWLAQVVTRAQRRGLRVIFDEVMTGFGRTGRLFAFQHLPDPIRPDIVCLSKGITGGFLPLAVTVARQEIYDAFLGDDFATALVHGHSYTANPLACAAALASIELFAEEQTLVRIAEQEKIHRRFIKELSRTKQHRVLGAIAACELEKSDPRYSSAASLGLRKRFLDAGLLVRPLGNSLYLLPPACLEPGELETAYQRIEQVLRRA